MRLFSRAAGKAASNQPVTAITTLRMLSRYSAWATALLYKTVCRLPNDEIVKPRSVLFGSLLRTLNHVYAMDLVWQAHLEGRSHGMTTRNPQNPLPLAELRALQTACNEWFVDYADAMTHETAEEVLQFEFIGGGIGSMSRGNISLHVVNHTTYHRGHVADMLYGTAVSPPTTDLPVFLRDAG